MVCYPSALTARPRALSINTMREVDVPPQFADQLALELPPREEFLPVAASAAENAAQVYGLDRDKALRLALAVEEFFAYLCRHAGREEPVRLTLSSGGTFVRADFRFRVGEVSLRALNFAARVNLEGEGAHDDLGLLLAARTTDRCSLELGGADVFHLHAEVDRAYPEGEPIVSAQRLAAPVSVLDAPDEGRLRHAAMLAAGRYPARLCPASFFRPARFADMAQSGQYHALLAVDAGERPAGLICWRAPGGRSVMFSGPYVFDPALGADTARLLTERFLALVARTETVCAISERPTADLPPGWFERLGTLRFHGTGDGGQPAEQPAYYRHLREDDGAAVWAHPELMDFLRSSYDRLAFSRDILRAEEQPGVKAGPRLAEHSLLATALDLRKDLALLKPLLPGKDMRANLAAHVEALNERGIRDILLHLDLSQPWQGALYPQAAQAGFAPRLVLPHAGSSDLLVCQHVPADL